MEKFKRLILLTSAALIIGGCDNNSSSSSESPDSSSSSSEEPISPSWNDQQKALIKQYCGEVLPYPSGFSGEVSVTQQYDESTSSSYLLIANLSDTFTIGDYYLDLETASWSGIRGYNGEIAQTNSSNETYYELTKISEDKGYEIIYTHFSEGNEETDKKYNVIQCFNDLNTELSDKTDWSEDEKNLFNSHLTVVPSLLKLGSDAKLAEYNNDMVYCHDTLAKDLTLENVEILKKEGYELDEPLSESKGAYILNKKLADGQTIIASLYYSGGNIVSFAYQVKVQYVSEWPSLLTADFKEKTGFDVPTFYSANGYYYYTNKGVTTIYAYTSDAYSYLNTAQMVLNETLIVDNSHSWYTDWEENFYVKPEASYDSQVSSSVYGIKFALLDEPYDEIAKGWPSEKISSFMKENGIEGEYPAFDFASLAASESLRVETINYKDAYDAAYAKVKANPDLYDIDPTDEEAIKACAANIAKQQAGIKIKILETGERIDPSNSSSEKANKVFAYLQNACYKAGMAKVYNYNFNYSYENASGSMVVGLQNYLNMTTITITYGSGTTHEPKFYFESKSVNLAAGNSYNLDITIDMLPYEVTYISNNDKITVNDEGCVKVADDAEAGTTATITASLTDGNGKVWSDTCTITVPDTYTKEKVISIVADVYNKYFGLSSDNDGAAKPQSIGDDPDRPIYYFTVLTTSETKAELEKFVESYLIPSGFKTTYDSWDGDMTMDDDYKTPCDMISYYYYDEDYNATNLVFRVYVDHDTNKVALYVRVA